MQPAPALARRASAGGLAAALPVVRDSARSPARARLEYRPEIDGLRALAIVPVVLFHAGIPGFAGGYLGVDVFFVISGYLITSLILVGVQTGGRYSFRSFYERRARRILPALFVVMLTSLPFAWLLLTPEALRGFGASLLSTSFFYSNILFWRESGYFDVATELKPLQHTWSLSIEEQFYLVFPITLVAIYRRAPRLVGPVLLAGMLVSLVLAEALNGGHPRATFYLAHGRAWELLLGAYLAFRERTAPFAAGSRSGGLLTLAGLLLVVGSMFAFDRGTPHPGIPALAPTLGTALVIVCGRTSSPARWLLTRRAVVLLGLISYSLYLWHQPVFAFARAWTVREISLAGYVCLIGLSLLLAWLTWTWVERPFRDRQQVVQRTLWNLSAAAAALLVLFGGLVLGTNGLPQRF